MKEAQRTFIAVVGVSVVVALMFAIFVVALPTTAVVTLYGTVKDVQYPFRDAPFIVMQANDGRICTVTFTGSERPHLYPGMFSKFTIYLADRDSRGYPVKPESCDGSLKEFGT